MTDKWKKFEELAFEIQQKLSPNAMVKLNDKIRGKSGRSREIDISIRQKIGQFDLLVVIDCKDYKNPVDIKAVESFIGYMFDVGANQGALVSSSGYTKSAIDRAKIAGVNLYHLGNTLSEDITKTVGIPSLCFVSNLKKPSTQISFSHPKRFEIHTSLIIYNSKREPLGTEQEILENWWFNKTTLFEPGLYKEYIINNNELFLLSGDDLISIELKANFFVEKLIFYRVQPIQFIGYKDVIKDIYNMQQITLDSLSIESLQKDWILIDLPNLAIKPTFTCSITTMNFDFSC